MDNSETINKKSNHKKLGLVLGGGGARGLAHIGVLKVLAENNLSVSYLSGCSMGGLIASLFAAGLSIDEIEKAARKLNSVREIVKLIDRTPSRRGLLSGVNIRKYLRNLISPEMEIQETRIPVVVNAVDLITGREVVLSEGNLLESIMATTAVPGFFPAVDFGPYRLVDGGMLNDVPVNLLRDTPAEVVVAVDVHQRTKVNPDNAEKRTYEHIPMPLPSFMQDFYRVEHIMTSAFVDINLKNYPPDLLVRPDIPIDVTLFWGFQRVHDLIVAGEEAMRSQLPILLEKLEI